MLSPSFADPDIRAVLAPIGGEDQITVIPHLDADAVGADPKPFLGYSDNTNLLCWLWTRGVAGFHGGSTQVHLGPGPAVDPCHAASLRAALLMRAALLTGERLEVTEPRRVRGLREGLGRPGRTDLVRRADADRAMDLGGAVRPTEAERAAHREAQRDVALETIARYHPDAVVCVGVPFGHTRPQWILPHGGEVTVDGASQRVWADYA